jgi:hypothetical protein
VSSDILREERARVAATGGAHVARLLFNSNPVHFVVTILTPLSVKLSVKSPRRFYTPYGLFKSDPSAHSPAQLYVPSSASKIHS